MTEANRPNRDWLLTWRWEKEGRGIYVLAISAIYCAIQELLFSSTLDSLRKKSFFPITTVQ